MGLHLKHPKECTDACGVDKMFYPNELSLGAILARYLQL